MHKQKGYINMDGIFTALIVVGVFIGLVIGVVVPWLWSLVKPWIHAVTG